MVCGPWILINTRVKEKLRSGELMVPGDQWPVFLYSGLNYDADDPWKGLFRNPILVSVSGVFIYRRYISLKSSTQAYKHVFTSPSSVEKEAKATRSGNARIHGMTSVTPASIAYISTQVLYKYFLDHST